jgi:ribosomal protein S18 acetylase RimI-like enzyme
MVMEHVVRSYHPDDRESLVRLWSACDLIRPWNDPNRDIDRKLAWDASRLLVIEHDTSVVGSVMVGYDGHRGWVNYLAVGPGYQRRGLGRILMQRAEELLGELGCAKLNLQIRSSNEAAIGFYRRLGYRVDESVSMGKRLELDGA